MSVAASKFESNVPPASNRVAVVLCCTEGDVEVVTSLAEALRESHNAEPRVVLLAGESFSELADLAAANVGHTVLYVLCRGNEISVPAIQQVRQVLRGHAGGQFMTVQITSVERMETSLAAALEGPRFRSSGRQTPPPATIRGTPAANSKPPRRGGGLPGPRGIMTVPPKAPRQAPTSPPRTLMGAAPGLPPGGAAGQGPRTLMGAAPAPETFHPEHPANDGPAPTLMGHAPAPQEPAFHEPSADNGPRTLMGQAPPPEELFAQSEDGPKTLMGHAPAAEGELEFDESAAAGWVSEDEEASVSGSATVTFGVSPQLAPPSRAQPQLSFVQVAQQKTQQAWRELWSPERRGLKLGIAGGLVVLIPALALMIWFAMDDDSESSPKLAQRDRAAASEPRPVAHQEPALDDLEDSAPPPAKETEPVKAQAPVKATPEPAPKRVEQVAVKEATGAQSKKYREFLRVEAALRKPRIRGLDALIIDTSKSKTFNFRAARRHCNRKEAGKLSGWRLPTGRELSRVASANMVGKGRFWAQPSGRSKRTYIWDARRKKLVKKSRRFRGARALCVRDRVITAGR